VVIPRSGQNARFTFNGTEGDQLGISITNVTITPAVSHNVAATVLRPNGTILGSTTASNGGIAASDLPALPETGTYVLYVEPLNGATANATVTVSADVQATLVADDAAVNATITQVGQTARFAFEATAGQRLGIGFNNFAVTPAGSSASLLIYKPDKTFLTSIGCNLFPGCSLNFGPTGSGPDFVNLPATGTYTALVTLNGPSGVSTATGSFTATLSSEAVGTLDIGAPLSVSIPRSGKNARFTFEGTVGQQLGIGVTNVSISPTGSANLSYVILKPDGTSLTSSAVGNGGTGTLDVPALPITGTYTLYVEPQFGATASAIVTVSADVQVALAIDGPPTDITLAHVGQAARLSVEATAGQRLGLGISDVILSQPGYTVGVWVYKPDNAILTSTNCNANATGCSLNFGPTTSGPGFVNIPTTGTYTVVIASNSGQPLTGSFKATLSSEVVGTLSPGTPANLALSRAGQNARFTFDGSAGQQLGFGFSNIVTSPANGVSVSYYVLRPDGVALTSVIGTNGGVSAIDIPALPTTGTYTVFIEPSLAGAASSQFTLSADVETPLMVDGTPSDVTLAHLGQTARLGFSATAGQRLGLAVSNIVLNDPFSSGVSMVVYKPDGTTLTSNFIGPGSVGWSFNFGLTNSGPSFVNLPQTGVYTLVVTPQRGSTGSFRATLSSEMTGDLSLGTSNNVSIPRAGQNARFFFEGVAGQQLSFSFTGVSVSPSSGANLAYYVLRPDGVTVGSGTVGNGSGNTLNFSALPSTGTYALYAEPSQGATASFTATPTTQSPIVSAGGDQTAISGNNVSLSGSATPNSGRTIATYAWIQTAGPAVTLTGANTAAASFNAPTVAANTVLTFRLMVSDNLGAAGADTVTVTVQGANTAPTANAGADQTVDEGTVVTLAGSGTDSDGAISAYLWTQTAGPTVTLSNANSATASLTAPQVTGDTVLTFTLTVTDNNGATGSASTNVTVRNVNRLPTANAGPAQAVDEGNSVTLAGSGSDTDGTIISYAWVQTAGPVVTLSNTSAAASTFTAPAVTAETVLTFQLTVTDNDADTGAATTNVTVRNVNVPPVANAGDNQTASEGTTVTLTGSGTDSDGTIISYAWTQIAGPAVTLAGANTAIVSFTAPQVTAETVLTFRLTVADDNGAPASATVNVAVQNVNQLPAANAGAAQTVNEGAAVTLNGSGTDADGTIVSYAWLQTAGPVATLSGANTASAAFTAPAVTADTVLTFQLTVTDNDGGMANATVDVTAKNINQLPTANAGAAQTVDENTAVSLPGSGTDPDGTIASYAWTQTVGPAASLSGANTATATFTAPAVTTDTPLVFQLTVTDNDGGTANATVDVTVKNVNQLPTANAGAAQTVDENTAVSLSGSGTDSDGMIASYAWTQTAGPAVTLSSANTASAGFTAPNVAADTVLTFQLTVTDNDGGTSSTTTTVTVRNVNVPPTANAGANQTVNEAVAVNLSGLGTDTDGTIASYAWIQTAGPAVTLSGANTATANFTAPTVTANTTLTFRLTVTDNNGATGNATTNVTVNNVNQLPTANAGANQTVNEGVAVTLAGSGSDPDGTIASYAWTQTVGPAVTLSGANTATATFTAPTVNANTVLTFQLTVTDNQGGTGSATTNVTVTNLNQLPAANAGPDQTRDEGSLVTLNGSGTDPDGTIASYAWTQTAGPAVTLSGANTATANFTAPTVTANTTLTFRLTVRDSSNATAMDTVNVTVRNVTGRDLIMTNISTTATEIAAGRSFTIANTVKNQGTTSITTSFTVRFYLSTDSSITSSDTSIGSRTVSTLNAGASSSANTSVTVPSTMVAGTYFIGAIADSANTQAESNEANNALAGNSIQVIINTPPVANAGTDQTVNEGAPVTLNGSGTDGNGTIASYAWTQTAGPTVTLSGANTASPMFTAPQIAANTTLTFRLTIRDNHGATASDTVNVVVRNVSVSGKDLLMIALSTTTTQANPGQSFTVSNTVKNQGTTSITTSFPVRIYLSTDDTITTSDRAIGTRTVSSLNVGATSASNTTVTIPSTLAPGTYFIGAIADYTNVQAESNESNNAHTGSTIVVQ
jgi:hypothetical protein